MNILMMANGCKDFILVLTEKSIEFITDMRKLIAEIITLIGLMFAQKP